MRRLTCEITIGKFVFDFANEVTIQTSWKRLTDTATITLPRKLKWQDKFIKDEVKKGDEVEIKLGYDFNLVTEFSGFVTQVRNGVPVQIQCEDAMWKLKQTNVTKSWRSVRLPQMLKEILPAGTKLNALDADLGPFRISKVSVAKVLEELRRQYGFCSFFRDGVLVVGFPYSQVTATRGAYVFEENIKDDRLEYRKNDDVKIKVRAVSMLPGGGSIEQEIGDADGELHSLHFYNLSTAQLKESAKQESARLRYEGFRGGFEAFGDPFIRHSDISDLSSSEYPERNGAYLVDETRVSWGLQGYQRELKLGPKTK